VCSLGYSFVNMLHALPHKACTQLPASHAQAVHIEGCTRHGLGPLDHARVLKLQVLHLQDLELAVRRHRPSSGSLPCAAGTSCRV
jgi:hypothetical protein